MAFLAPSRKGGGRIFGGAGFGKREQEDKRRLERDILPERGWGVVQGVHAIGAD